MKTGLEAMPLFLLDDLLRKYDNSLTSFYTKLFITMGASNHVILAFKIFIWMNISHVSRQTSSFAFKFTKFTPDINKIIRFQKISTFFHKFLSLLSTVFKDFLFRIFLVLPKMKGKGTFVYKSFATIGTHMNQFTSNILIFIQGKLLRDVDKKIAKKGEFFSLSHTAY